MKKDLKHILIVDDEVDICFLLKNILKRKTEAQIDICYSVSKAKVKLEESNYDLAFLDMRLNDGTGEEIIEYINDSVTEKPYIAVISAYSSEIDRERLDRLAVNQFIPKPLTTEKIMKCFLAARA